MEYRWIYSCEKVKVNSEGVPSLLLLSPLPLLPMLALRALRLKCYERAWVRNRQNTKIFFSSFFVFLEPMAHRDWSLSILYLHLSIHYEMEEEETTEKREAGESGFGVLGNGGGSIFFFVACLVVLYCSLLYCIIIYKKEMKAFIFCIIATIILQGSYVCGTPFPSGLYSVVKPWAVVQGKAENCIFLKLTHCYKYLINF